MLELVGNCYDDLPRGSSMRDECKRTVGTYLEVGNDTIKMKVKENYSLVTVWDIRELGPIVGF